LLHGLSSQADAVGSFSTFINLPRPIPQRDEVSKRFAAKSALVFLLLCAALLVTSRAAGASSSGGWEGEWRQSSSADFGGGTSENVWITRAGGVQLFVGNYYGNEFVATSRYTSSARLDDLEKRLSLRFAAGENETLVRIRAYFYQSGSILNWRVRLESDDGSEDHRPSGALAWPGAEALVALDANGWAIIPIEPGDLVEGRVYHVVVSPAQTPTLGDYINPGATRPFNEFWVNGSPGNRLRGVLFSSDGGSAWELQDNREPVYVLDFADGTCEGNPYFSYTSKSIKEDDFHGESFAPSTDITVSAVEFYVKRTSGVPSDSLYVAVSNGTEDLMAPLENQGPIGTDYSWVRYDFPEPLTFLAAENYRIHLESPSSTSGGYYYVDFLDTSSGAPYPGLSYDGANSFYVRSSDGGATWSSSSGNADDLAFRLVLTYRASGTYTSRPLDAGSKVGWGEITWTATQPDCTALDIQTRTSDDGRTWSAWESCSNGGEPGSPSGRYLQCRALLQTSIPSVSPVLHEMVVKYNDILPPTVTELSPFDGQIILDRAPMISATLADDLSGIDPLSIQMWVDNVEVQPTYDAYRGELWYQPLDPLERGEVTVRARASDRGGNSATLAWAFRVDPAAVSVRHPNLENSAAERERDAGPSMGSGDLTLRPLRSGVVGESFPSPPGEGSRTPRDLAVVGNSLWITDSGRDKLYEVDCSGNVLSEFSTPGSDPRGIAWDGARLWYFDRGSRFMHEIDLEALGDGSDMSDAAQPVWEIPVSEPTSLAWGDGYLWLLDDTAGDEAIYKFTMDGGAVESFSAPGSSPAGIAWHGGHIWCSDSGTDTIYWMTTDGTVLGSFPAPGETARGLASDGDHLWHIDSGEDLVYELYPFEYYLEGTFTSPVIDAGVEVKWDLVWWVATVPENTSLLVEARLSDDNRVWTGWRRCANREPVPGSGGRFIQYRVMLESSVASRTPALHQLEFIATDAVAPIIGEFNPSREGFTNSSRPAISAILHDDFTGVDSSSIVIELDNRRADCLSYEAATGRVSHVSPSDLEDGVHLVKVSGSDEEGNLTSAIWSFTVDTVAPSVTITSPADNFRAGEREIVVRGAVDDPATTVVVNGFDATVGEDGSFEATVELDWGRNTVVASAVDRAGNIGQDSISGTYEPHVSALLAWGVGGGLAIGIAAGLTLTIFGKKYSKKMSKIKKRMKFW